ncbi:MAG: hypothetical protein KME26_20790 [Oscillatoria princeps RMCB-10]|nr:hypothetical protein [Oscillatoria princeps RMCB-10]
MDSQFSTLEIGTGETPVLRGIFLVPSLKLEGLSALQTDSAPVWLIGSVASDY